MTGKTLHSVLCVMFALALLSVLPGPLFAQVTVTNTFSSGSAANAADVNQNFTDLTDGLNTHINNGSAHTDTDTDTLGALVCAAGEVSKWDGAAWACAVDQDTWLSEATVDSYAGNNGYLTTSDAAATYQPIPTRIFTVGPVGTDLQNGTALLSAYNAITATPAYPALLKIEPGPYELSTSGLGSKSYVSIQGSGKYATIIRQTSPSFWAVATGSNTSISDLTIESNAASMASGLNLGVGSEARNLNVKAISSAGIATAVETGSDSRLINVDITATGFTQSNGVLAFGIATFHGVNITANGGNVNTGLKGSMSITSTGNRISIPSGSVRIGVENGSVHGSYISALGGVAVKWTSPYQIVNSTLVSDTGLLADFSAVWCVNCNGTVDRTLINSTTLSIDFSATAINNSGLHVGSSRMNQPVSFGINTTLVCVYNYDGATYTARDAQCQ